MDNFVFNFLAYFRIRSCGLLVAFLVGGCSQTHLFQSVNPHIGFRSEVAVGNSILIWKSGTQDQAGSWQSGLGYELIYTGRDNSTIFVAYREYELVPQGSMARPAFQLELRYDLTKSDTITFRDISAKVETATQEKIVYSILRVGTLIAKTDTMKVVKALPSTNVFGMEVNDRGVIVQIAENSIAQKLGFRWGDAIRVVDGVDVYHDGIKAMELLLKSNRGTATVTLDRRGTVQTITWER